MNMREFHNALRVLLNIDRHTLVQFGVIDDEGPYSWEAFYANPHRFFIKCSDARAAKLWRIMEREKVRATVAIVTDETRRSDVINLRRWLHAIDEVTARSRWPLCGGNVLQTVRSAALAALGGKQAPSPSGAPVGLKRLQTILRESGRFCG